MADEQAPRRWRRRDRSNERLELEAKEVRDAISALRSGDLDAAEQAMVALRMELRDEIRGSESYVPVVLLTLVLVIAVPLSTDHAYLSALLTVVAAVTVILSLHRSRIRPRVLRVLTGIAIATGVAGIVAIYAIDAGDTAKYLVAGSSALFAFLLAMTLPAMLRRVLTSGRVTINTLAGAIAAYLMLGLFFSTVFRFVSTLSETPCPPSTTSSTAAAPAPSAPTSDNAGPQCTTFFAQKTSPNGSDYEYFSFITITTVGYGDLTPGNDAARAGAVSEAIIGQVFLVTIVARVVSSLGFQHQITAVDPPDPTG